MRVVALLRLCVASSVAAVLLLGGCQILNRSTAADNLQGHIAWPKDGDLWVYDLATKQSQRITNLPSGAAVTGASWSPDGKRVVYAQFWRRPNERQSGADLFVANADGSDPQVFAERDAPNTVLEAPEWTPNGRVVYTIRRVQNAHESTSIVRQEEGAQPEVLAENGVSPGISPDGSTLVYVRATQNGQELMKKTIGQTGDGCALLSDQVFQYISLPRISPDGTHVAMGGSGEPNIDKQSGCGGDPHAKPSASGVFGSPVLNLAALVGPDVAEAHGLPADIWSMNLDGSNMQRVADIKDDDPSVAWSPDGSRLAIFGVAALYVSDLKGGSPAKLVDQGGYGGLDWTSR